MGQTFLGLAIFGSFWWFAIISTLFIFLLFLSENDEQGLGASAAVIVYCVINHFWGNIPLSHLLDWRIISSYLGLGLIYAVIRTYFFGRKLDRMYESDISDIKNNVFRWWFLFPVSLTYWLFSDLLGDMWDVISNRISNGFVYVLKRGFHSKNK